MSRLWLNKDCIYETTVLQKIARDSSSVTRQKNVLLRKNEVRTIAASHLIIPRLQGTSGDATVETLVLKINGAFWIFAKTGDTSHVSCRLGRIQGS